MSEGVETGSDAVRLVDGSYVELQEAQSPSVEHFDALLDGLLRILDEHGELPVMVCVPDGRVPPARLRQHMWRRFNEASGWGRVAVVYGHSPVTRAALSFSARIIGLKDTRFFETRETAREWLCEK